MKKITVGRSSSCDIMIPDASISRVHAEISRNGNEFIYSDLGRNGTSINGRIIHNERVIIAPGTPVLLAGRVPLPWAQIYTLLPGGPYVPSEQSTVAYNGPTRYDAQPAVHYDAPPAVHYDNPEDKLNVGWGILAFIIPIAGFIMYFVWKGDTPKRAGKAGTLGLIGMAVNLLIMYGI